MKSLFREVGAWKRMVNEYRRLHTKVHRFLTPECRGQVRFVILSRRRLVARMHPRWYQMGEMGWALLVLVPKKYDPTQRLFFYGKEMKSYGTYAMGTGRMKFSFTKFKYIWKSKSLKHNTVQVPTLTVDQVLACGCGHRKPLNVW